MSEVVGAFLRTEFGGEDTDPARETRNGSLGCFSQMRFEFAKRLLDRIEIWRKYSGKVTRVSHRPLQSPSRTPATLCTGRLSIITMSPRLRVEQDIV